MAVPTNDWTHILPPGVAATQSGYERRMIALRMKNVGLTYAEIAERFGVSHGRARELVAGALNRFHGRHAPAAIYLGPNKVRAELREMFEGYAKNRCVMPARLGRLSPWLWPARVRP